MNQKHVSRLFWAVKALLAGTLLYAAVTVVVTPLQLGKALRPQQTRGDQRADDSTPICERPDDSPADLSAILENDLFGGAGSQTSPGQGGAADGTVSAEEELGLRLIGAIAGQSPAARAIIQNVTTGTALPYRIGDSVARATIESIQSDRVVLRHEGRRKILRLRSGALQDNGRPGTGQAPRQAGPGAQVLTEGQEVRTSSGMSYIEDVFHKATIEPYARNGRSQGLRITGIEDTPFTRMVGLKNGDIVQMVNGQSLTNKQKAFQVLQKARTQPKLQIQLLRDGKTKELSFDLQ